MKSAIGSAMLLAMALLGPAAGSAAAERSDGLRFVPNAPDQFLRLTRNPEALGFHIGSSPNPSSCRHYQGVVRVDSDDGQAYLYLTRNGNTPDIWFEFFDEVACDDSPGERRNGNLVVVKLESRPTVGERLRSNRLRKGVPFDDTPPPPADRVVSFFTVVDGLAGGLVAGHGQGELTHYTYEHPGGMQAIGKTIAMAVDGPRQRGPVAACNICDLGWPPPLNFPIPRELYDQQCALCNGHQAAPNQSMVMFLDVSEPEAPRFLSQFVPRNAGGDVLPFADGIAITALPNGRYLMAITPAFPNERLYFYRSVQTRLDDPGLAWEFVNQIPLPETEDPHQAINFIRQGSIDGELFLAGSRGKFGAAWERNRMDLYRIHCATPDCAPGEHISLAAVVSHKLVSPFVALGGSERQVSLAAAGGFYVSPTGELLFYATEHDNDGPAGSVKAGEWRHRDVVRASSPTLRPTAIVGGPYTVDEGSSVELVGGAGAPRTRAWIQFFNGLEVDPQSWNWIVDHDDRDRDDYDNFGALGDGRAPLSETSGGTARSLKWYAPEGCSIRVHDSLGPIPGARTLSGTGAMVYMPDLREVLNDAGTAHLDRAIDYVEFADDCADYYGSAFVLEWDLDRDGFFETQHVAPVIFDATFEDGPDVLHVPARATHPAGGAEGFASAQVIVNNVAPSIERLALFDGSGNQIGDGAPFILAGRPVVLDLEFSDPGVLDHQTARVEWGDGTATETLEFDSFDDAFGDGFGSLTHRHRYLQPATYDLFAHVADDDGDSDSRAASLRVVSPEDALKELIGILASAIDDATEPDLRLALMQAYHALAGSSEHSANGALTRYLNDNLRAAIAMLDVAQMALGRIEAPASTVLTLVGIIQEIIAALQGD